MQYSDSQCTDPTGVEEIVSWESFSGEYSNGCGNGGNSTDFAVQCEDGFVKTQVYDSGDTTCSGNVLQEAVSYVVESACTTEPVDGFYYR